MSTIVTKKNAAKLSLSRIRLFVQLSVMVLMFAGIIRMSGWVFGLAAIAALFLGPVFCGWICPFGFIQEMIGEIGKKIRSRLNIEFPVLHSKLKLVRYAMLGFEIALAIAVVQNTIVISDTIKYAAVAAVIVLNLISQRFFCKYLCPVGAVLSITNLFKVFAVKKEHACPECGACRKKCMMNVEMSTIGSNRDTACISCFKCLESCPGGKEYLHF
jgi:ferredoxin-type protein NapH